MAPQDDWIELRREEKRRSRERDEADLRAGRKSGEELARENSPLGELKWRHRPDKAKALA